MRKITSLLLALILALMLVPTVSADETPQIVYELRLTDQNGAEVEDPRTLADGDTLYVEIVLERKNFTGAYDIFGLEFRLLTTGLQYNKDGTTLRRGTEVTERKFTDGDSVGFAWYDLQQKPETVYNPTMAAQWSYTVTDASIVNLKVPVALVYLANQTEASQPTGPAYLKLDVNGGQALSESMSGTYTSGTVVILPKPEKPGYEFLGWDDGGRIYPAGSEYAVSGIVTLTAQWREQDRDCQLTLDSNGGSLILGNISGNYAPGMVVILPAAPEREGYEFLGWSDGTNIYPAGGRYTITGSVKLVAQWKPIAAEDPEIPGIFDNWTLPGWVGPAVFWSVILLLMAAVLWFLRWLLLLIPLWKRDYVQYSLQTGDLMVNYTNEERRFQVSVVLDEDGRKQTLGKSEMMEAGTHLEYIPNADGWPIADRKPGIYKGKLVIQGEGWFKINECNIKFLDKDLEE